MNKKWFLLVLGVLFSVLQCGTSFSNPVFAQLPSRDSSPLQEKRMRGLWVTTVFQLDYPSVVNSNLKEDAVAIIENAKKNGFNAIFLQVRPSGDAFYRSKIVKWSKFLTGKRGVAPSDAFDPLAYWIEECHKRGMELHAWLNPYRIATDPDDDVSEFKKEWILVHENRRYLNPGIPEVREHLHQVVDEILQGYKVDGIHFDDYFYPSTDIKDEQAFRKYGRGKTLAAWRTENVDRLIRDIHDLCREKGVSFGVSPFGIWANKNTHPLGSDTGGFESLTGQYADTRKWVKEGWVDYICPQIYWHKGFEVADYEVLVDWWRDVVKGTDVSLYIGLASYKTMDADIESPWYGTTELLNQMNYNAMMPGIGGEIHFRYAGIQNSPVLAKAIRDFYLDADRYQGYGKTQLIVGRPYEDTVTYSDTFFVGGMSDPKQPLYINGERIDDRTKSGLFGKYYALLPGENRFELVCGKERYTRVVTRKISPPWSPNLTDIISAPFPNVWKAYYSGERFQLRCVAPAGTRVFAVLDGVSYELEQQDDVEYGYASTFSREVSFKPTGKARVVWLGKARYECYRDGVLISSAEAEQPIEIIMDGAPLHAEVVVEYADTYLDNSREIGAFHIVPRGTRDSITGEDGDLFRLGSGLWIKKNAVRLVWEGLKENKLLDLSIHPLQPEEERISSRVDSEGEVIEFRSVYTPILFADLEDDVLAVDLHGVDFSGQDFGKIKGKLIKKASLDKGRLLLTLNNVQELAGWYSESASEGKYSLVLRAKKKSMSETKPLEDIVIMLDPGHGGYDTGGISLFGSAYSEKQIVLDLSFRLKRKLEEKGAIVLMTRVNDLYVSLYDRLRYSRKALPDLFLSMHTDSLYESSDLSKIRGASVFYKHLNAKALAEEMAATIYERSELDSRGHHEYNFYVCRGTWAPSLLLENGFACSPFDLEFVMDYRRSEDLLNDYVENIVDYFRH